jgi:hypothetical protein
MMEGDWPPVKENAPPPGGDRAGRSESSRLKGQGSKVKAQRSKLKVKSAKVKNRKRPE